MSVVNTAMRTI